MVKSLWWGGWGGCSLVGGGPCDFSVSPSPELEFWILDCFGFGFGIGSRGTGLQTRA